MVTLKILRGTSSFYILFFLAFSFPFFFSFLSIFFKNLDIQDASAWSPAGATWYGEPNGAGSTGGACGYQNAVEQPPFSALISAGGPSLFKSGMGCGACYQVRCRANALCSGNPVTVVITDECAGCVSEPVHFDLSGTAFGAMAISGRATELRNVGVLQIEYRRVGCNYPGYSVALRVATGSNPYYFAVVALYENGDGDISAMYLREMSGSGGWLPMQHSWGATWKLDSRYPLQAPFSIRLTGSSGRTLVANNVIPAGWEAGKTYWSTVNF
ncbi:hypothetical protein NMG60_11029173 [Bertholletia excelsa]